MRVPPSFAVHLAAATVAIAGCNLHVDLDTVEGPRARDAAVEDADAARDAEVRDAEADTGPDADAAADADAEADAADTHHADTHHADTHHVDTGADADADADAPPNLAPEVTLEAPAPGAQVRAGDPVRIAWRATDPDGVVATIEVLLDGEARYTLSGDQSEWAWPQAVLGQHQVSLRATDDRGATAESSPLILSVYTTMTFQDGVSPSGYAGTRDAEITSVTEAQPLGADPVIEADLDSAALVRWALEGVPSDAILLDARVRFHRAQSTSNAFHIYEMHTSWNELEATWLQAADGKPWETPGAKGASDRGDTVLGTVDEVGTAAISVVHTEDFAPVVERWLSDPERNYGIIMTHDTHADGLYMRSREATPATERPALEIRYTLPLP